MSRRYVLVKNNQDKNKKEKRNYKRYVRVQKQKEIKQKEKKQKETKQKNKRRYVRVKNSNIKKQKERKKQIKAKKAKNFLIIFILSIIILLFSLYIIKWIITNKKDEQIIDNIVQNEVVHAQYTYEDNKINIVNIDTKKLNENVKGWIKIDDTNIDYPIMQANNNTYYLNHNIDGQENSSGSIFVDYRNNMEQLDKNTIIYGHNMKNNTMFAGLVTLYKKGDFSNSRNKYFYFSTLNQKYICEIISVYKIEASEFEIKNVFTNREFASYIDEIKQKSIYNFNTKVNEDDKIITLYTCDDTNKDRIILQAKLNIIN